MLDGSGCNSEIIFRDRSALFLERGLENAVAVCSREVQREYDPVCAGHSPERDHSERFLEGSACQGCLFVAESSCKRFNRYLDRSLVTPTLGHPAALAFFDPLREGLR
ncbi:MAG TPA: hypothetical protein VGH73_17845 [Thermoanaerobaculia bacterium]